MKIKSRGFWLGLLFAVQPVLDALAYFTANERVTPAGYLRLAILILLPVCTLIAVPEKKKLCLFLLAGGAFCALHVLNCVRVGYISPYFDIRYLANVMQMPVFAFCLLLLIRNEETKQGAIRGFAAAAALTLLFLIVAKLTDTGNVTYGEGLGYSGWVIDQNRNANSTNLVIYAALCVWLALGAKRAWPALLIPLIIEAVFLINGTKGCFYSIFAIFAGYLFWLLLEKLWLKRPLRLSSALLFAFLLVFTVVIYPYTPRYRVEGLERKAATQGEIEATLLEKGIDITNMSAQERFDNPVVKEVFAHYYWKYLGGKPDIIDRFGMDRVLMQYKMSTDVGKLIDDRIIERNYADMIFQDCDTLTKIVGFEVSEVGFDGVYDLENDWHAIFYYYGYLGFALYVGFVLYFLLRIVRKLGKDLKHSLTTENFAYGLTFVLTVGLAHFSGATLRRPNVSIWLSLLLALIYTVTEVSDHETQRNHSGV